MCEEHNNRMGKACILIKSGRNMEGVIIISEIFLESVREYLSLLRKGSAEEERKPRILTQFRVVLQTCRKEWLIDNERGVRIPPPRKISGRRTPSSSSARWVSTTSTRPTSPNPSASSSTK